MEMIEIKRYSGVRVFFLGGKYFRLITEPLTTAEVGQNIVVYSQLSFPYDFIIGKFDGIEEDTAGCALRLRPDIIHYEYIPVGRVIGWIHLRFLFQDVNDSRLQSHPDSYVSVITHPIYN